MHTELARGRKLILYKLNYFHKNVTRMKYDQLRQRNLPCGSGIVESAIRRVINLRFKSASTFWKNENVEKLIFLRAIFLAGRWNFMINNLIKLNHKFLQLNLKLVVSKLRCSDYEITRTYGVEFQGIANYYSLAC